MWLSRNDKGLITKIANSDPQPSDQVKRDLPAASIIPHNWPRTAGSLEAVIPLEGPSTSLVSSKDKSKSQSCAMAGSMQVGEMLAWPWRRGERTHAMQGRGKGAWSSAECRILIAFTLAYPSTKTEKILECDHVFAP